VNKLLGRNDIEGALKRLDTLTVEEAQMAIAEILNVTNRLDDKVMVLIDGGQTVFLWLFSHPWTWIWLDVKESNQRSANTADEEKSSYYDLTYRWFSGLIYLHKEPVTRENAKVALSSGSLDKS
jgi:hypothetical protein